MKYLVYFMILYKREQCANIERFTIESAPELLDLRESIGYVAAW